MKVIEVHPSIGIKEPGLWDRAIEEMDKNGAVSLKTEMALIESPYFEAIYPIEKVIISMNEEKAQEQFPGFLFITQEPEDEDSISVRWHVLDVIDVAEGRGETITKEQAREVLRSMKARHDASIGINWDVIHAHLDFKPWLDEGEEE